MMTFILASSDYPVWQGKCKELLPVRGHTILDRTARMLGDREHVIVSHHQSVAAMFPVVMSPICRETLADTILSSYDIWQNYDEVCFLFGDVVWTQAALDKVLADSEKNYQSFNSIEEVFAFRFKNTRYEQVRDVLRFMSSKTDEPIQWLLYRCICGIPWSKHWCEHWHQTLILDKTIDIDYPEDHQKFIDTGYFDDKEFDL